MLAKRFSAENRGSGFRFEKIQSKVAKIQKTQRFSDRREPTDTYFSEIRVNL